MKLRSFSISKVSLGLLVCTLAFTTLIRGNASSESLVERQAALEVSLAASMFSSEEVNFFDSIGGENADFDQLEIELSTPSPTFFAYTKENGLDARANPFCERFLDRHGQYGVYGKVISSALNARYKENASTPMLADDVVGMTAKPSVCPNWRNLSINGRIRFWVWAYAAIASVESTCGVNPRTMTGVKSSFGHAIGLIQMNLEYKNRSWRGPNCKAPGKEIAQPYHNLRCGLDIMQGQLTGEWIKREVPIYNTYKNRDSYWQHLNMANGGTIGKLMRNFKPCFESKSSLPTLGITDL